MKCDNDDDCFGWSNDSYFSDPKWRNPDWKLLPKRYIAKVTIISSGVKREELFRVMNNVPRKDFRLERTLRQDYENVTMVI